MSAERDREVDAAWRAASREEPPPALDDAIRAEARRAVGAGPAEARRRRWRQLRYPFAAAATVALLAFGITQMIPPEDVGPGTVSDQPAPREREQLAENKTSAPASVAVAPAPKQEAPAGAASPQSAAPSAAAPSSAPAATAERAPPASVRQKPQTPAREEQAKKELLRKEGAERFATAPPQRESGTADSSARSVAENTAKSEPFPAAPRVAASVPPAEESARAQAPEPAKPAADARRDANAQAQQPPGSAATAVGQVRSRTDAAKISDLDELKAKDAGAESVEAWIARIRELKTSGQADAAAKELAKFRSAFGERADALLPADLRAIAPARP